MFMEELVGKRNARQANTIANFVWFMVFVGCVSALVIWGSSMLENDPYQTAGEHDHDAPTQSASAPTHTHRQ